MNTLAREQMKAAGRPRSPRRQDARSSPGSTTKKQNIYNRERWRVAEVDAAEAEIERHSEHLEHYRSASHSVHPSNEERALEQIAAARAEREQLPEIGHEARAKAAVAEGILAERERAAATAARLSPPDYIRSELGERPSDPPKAREWDKAVRGIEGYRVRNGVGDRDTALGPKLHDHTQAHEHARAERQLQQTQRRLQLQRSQQRAAEQSIHLGIG